MTMHIDKRMILDVWPLIEAHTVDGRGEYDGMYCINYTILFRKTCLERTALYPTAEECDEAFAALSVKVREEEAARDAEHASHHEQDDDEGESHVNMEN